MSDKTHGKNVGILQQIRIDIICSNAACEDIFNNFARILLR